MVDVKNIKIKRKATAFFLTSLMLLSHISVAENFSAIKLVAVSPAEGVAVASIDGQQRLLNKGDKIGTASVVQMQNSRIILSEKDGSFIVVHLSNDGQLSEITKAESKEPTISKPLTTTIIK